MPIQVEWDNPRKSTIRAVFGERWTLEDLHQLIDDARALMETVPHRVDVILDLTETKYIPPNLLPAAGRADRLAQPNLGLIVAAHAPTYLKALIDALRNIAPSIIARTACVATLEDARSFLGNRTKPAQR